MDAVAFRDLHQARDAGYQSSGTLATPVTLQANYYYAIGVSWGSASVSYYYSSATLPVTTSFGSLFSGMSYSATTVPASLSYLTSSSTIYPQRLTLGP